MTANGLAVPADRDRLVPDGDAAPPFGITLPADPALRDRDREQRLLPVRTNRADDVVRQRRRRGCRPYLRQRDPRVLGLERRPERQIGKGQVGEQFPVRHQRVQPLQVRGARCGPAWPGHSSWAHPHHRTGRSGRYRRLPVSALPVARSRSRAPGLAYCLVTSRPWLRTSRQSPTAALRRSAAARAHGAQTIFTLSGGHVFPVYDGAVKADPPMPILDVQARADGGLRRRSHRPPDQDTRIRRADRRAGGHQRDQRDHHRAFQRIERGRARRPGARLPLGLGQPAGIRPPSPARPDHQACLDRAQLSGVGRAVSEAFALATARHRGPVFLDVSLEALFGAPDPADQRPDPGRRPASQSRRRGRPARPGQRGRRGSLGDAPDPGGIAEIVALLIASASPVLVLGSDVWLDGAEYGARAAAEELRLPVVANGQGRGILPAGHELARHPRPIARRSARPTWSSWSARRWTSGSATASTAARTAQPPQRSCTSPTRRARSPRTGRSRHPPPGT